MLDMRSSLYVRPLPGKSCIYHVGCLSFDREMHPAADAAGEQAWKDYESGCVTLVQHKLEPDVYQYIAIGL